jgi:predicted nucleic acid-binding protein
VQSTWIEQRAVENSPTLTSLASTLHRGERQAIALAVHLGSQLLIDEYKGREVAQEHGLEVIGSLAVLAEAKRRSFIEQVRPILSALITSGYWLDASLITTFLAEMGEPVA